METTSTIEQSPQIGINIIEKTGVIIDTNAQKYMLISAKHEDELVVKQESLGGEIFGYYGYLGICAIALIHAGDGRIALLHGYFPDSLARILEACDWQNCSSIDLHLSTMGTKYQDKYIEALNEHFPGQEVQLHCHEKGNVEIKLK